MAKTILASLTGLVSDRAVLDAAVAAVRMEGGHIQCLYAPMGVIRGAALAEAAVSDCQTEPLFPQQALCSDSARTAFNDACRRHALPVQEVPSDATVSIAWRQLRSVFDEALLEAPYHDLIVMAREESLAPQRIENMLIHSGRPVLLVPCEPVAAIGRKVVVAWKSSPESARALTAASSILSRAEQVTIVSVSENEAGDDRDRYSAEHLANILQWKGIDARVAVRFAPKREAAALLKAAASDYNADLIVMGGYGHSRIRELVLGGFTREVLADCPIPVLMVG